MAEKRIRGRERHSPLSPVSAIAALPVITALIDFQPNSARGVREAPNGAPSRRTRSMPYLQAANESCRSEKIAPHGGDSGHHLCLYQVRQKDRRSR